VIKRLFGRVSTTRAPNAVVLIRLLVGWVFVAEGLQKFLFPDDLGAGRFAKIGIPFPTLMGPFVGAVEVLAGALVILGLMTRLASLLLLVDMGVAIASTKIPILVGHGVLGFADPKGKVGLWPMLHEARTDFSMVLGCAFLLIVGGGKLSIDVWLARRLSSD
jgi:uncharacterized membrane protein YphA (DoxX/SURF4 family)